MGGCQSKKHVAETRASSNGSKRSSGQANNPATPKVPQTRKRTDSWANAPSTLGNNNNNNTKSTTNILTAPTKHSSRTLAEAQWNYLWQTHSPFLADPVDVPAVIDLLLNKTINRLSSVQVTWLQRSVRAAVGSLPSPGSPSKLVAKFVPGSSSQQQQPPAALAEKMRVLHPSVWQRVLPVAAWSSQPLAPRRNSSNSNLAGSSPNASLNGTDAVVSVDWSHVVLNNLEQILLHLSDADWERVTLAASHAASAAGLEMDVNKRDKGWKMPRPSAVPEITDPAGTPPGVTLQALSAVVAIAVAGTRAQQLQLLFYLLLPNLDEFLALHPAGGAPLWLLEVGNETVVSLASLTHYHYYGTTFLPLQGDPTSNGSSAAANGKKSTKPKFSPSQSRKPLKIEALTLHDMLLKLCQQPSSMNGKSCTESGEGSSSGSPPNLQQRLDIHASELYTDEIKESFSKMQKSITDYALDPDVKQHWTLDEFAQWMDQSFDENLLEFVMHRLFAAGIFPSHLHESRWVRRAWDYWLEKQPYPLPKRKNPNQNGKANYQYHDRIYNQVVGGLGGVDSRGGLGYGLLYCIDQKWWRRWVVYVGWSWSGEQAGRRRAKNRPPPLSNGSILEQAGDHEDGIQIPGKMGSYEILKRNLSRDRDYVLVPPGVWNVLYELYGGGPPLPRMIRPPSKRLLEQYQKANGEAKNEWSEENGNQGKEVDWDEFSQKMSDDPSADLSRVPRLPDSLQVAMHPWVIHVQLCDPQQPYRRGEAGLISIRVMVTPDESLWRFFAELVARFPLHAFKAYDSDGSGRARLWKKSDTTATPGSKPPSTRYGPWNLLCKSRHATTLSPPFKAAKLNDYIEDWKDYTENMTIESSSLANQDRLMFEFAVQNKQGELTWPREDAAKAGRERRLVEEENAFRRTLQGQDKDGHPMVRPPNLVNMEVDAMDMSGRWYTVKILEVDIVDEDTSDEETEPDDDTKELRPTTTKKVRVDFSDHGGHMDWIDVESDRLGPAGRFTNETDPKASTKEGPPTSNGETKVKPVAVTKKSANNVNDAENSKLCTLPGYGACGLNNLGNTCYMNSALQCISYLPLLRAYLISGQYKATGDLNKDNPLGTGGKFLEESAELMKIMWSARQGEKSPSRFKALLGKQNPLFSGADQQDAQEFLNYMLDVLHEDSNRVRKKPYVEALEDDYVNKSPLSRVGDESWKRFLRRNRSIVADVAMGQVLNTVSCEACKHTSRNFDPFNLLSIPIPTVADVVFQCTVYRRATAISTPWVLNRSRKGSQRPNRFLLKSQAASAAAGPPSEQYVAEQYIVKVSRLADSGELRLQIENLCNIPATNLRLYRTEEVETDSCEDDEDTVLSRQIKLVTLNDKEGPCSQLAKKRLNDEDPSSPTHIVAFETTLRTRPPREKPAEEKEAADDAQEVDPAEIIRKHLESYGDEKECRIHDSDPITLSKLIARRSWPETADDLHVGLRVDAKDRQGHWFAGSVIAVFDEDTEAGDAPANQGEAKKNSRQVAPASEGEAEKKQVRKVTVHFDNFLSKWDETYTIKEFNDELIKPVFSHARPRAKPTEFVVYNRFTDASGASVFFGLPFYVHCRNEWTNARAAAHILAQASRFLYNPPVDPSERKGDSSTERAIRASRMYERVHILISELIDILIDHDREFFRQALGVSSSRDNEEKKEQKPVDLMQSLMKRVNDYETRLPFEMRVCSGDPVNTDKSQVSIEEEAYAITLRRTIGNYLHARNVIVLQWRSPPRDKSSSTTTILSPVMYINPPIHIHKASAEYMRTLAAKENSNKNKKGGNAGMDIGVCLKEYCKEQKLTLSDNWRCPRCKEFREARQDMNLWRLPDLLTFHIKRFNMSARWREKITTRVNFPLTGLDMSEWCHQNSPALGESPESCIYDLIGVVNHYGSMQGGHYVATCKATGCGKDGTEEVCYNFNGMGAGPVELADPENSSSGLRFLGRPKSEVNHGKAAAAVAAKTLAESVEPTWLQFDDELVEPVPPDAIVSEMAYVLFYRRRQISPANIARYSTMECKM